MRYPEKVVARGEIAMLHCVFDAVMPNQGLFNRLVVRINLVGNGTSNDG